MPEKVYRVKGQSTQRPTNLPEGFEVKETDVPVHALIPSWNGDHFLQVHEFSKDGVVTVGKSGAPLVHLDTDGLRSLRDTLNKILHSWANPTVFVEGYKPFRGRVYAARFGSYVFFEVEKNKFVGAYSWKDARNQQRHLVTGGVDRGWLNVAYGTLRDVTDEFKED